MSDMHAAIHHTTDKGPICEFCAPHPWHGLPCQSTAACLCQSAFVEKEPA